MTRDPRETSRDEVPAGTWVELERVILRPGERAPGIPADTAAVPFAARVRGFLLTPARKGTTGEVRTQADRVVGGRLRAVLPKNPADFGDPSPELLRVGKAMKQRLNPPPAATTLPSPRGGGNASPRGEGDSRR